MPRFDGTGPLGYGPRTGFGFGPCGRGFGFYPGRYVSSKSRLAALEEEEAILKEELDAIREEKAELKDQKS